MKNVIVFALAGSRYAVELRWVREVFPLGAVTPVPTAPAAIAGVVNFRGAIVPLLQLAELLAPAPAPARAAGAARSGDGAILLEVESTRFAIRVDNIDEVSTLHDGADGRLSDSRGRAVPLIDPPALVGAAMAATAIDAAPDPGAVLDGD
jgi:purine-binding chemotaxis protein CheW